MKVFPVIHVHSVQQVLEDVRVANVHPISGVFLIDHDANDVRLTSAMLAVRDEHPGIFLGVNFLRRTRRKALEIFRELHIDPATVDAIWADNADLDDAASRGDRPSPGLPLHFGGIAFKYQQPVPLDELPALGAKAREFVDVPTTSGRGTGMAADLERLRALRRGLGDHPLALASGVTPENIDQYSDLVTHVLVATGIAHDDGGFDERKLSTLLSRATR